MMNFKQTIQLADEALDSSEDGSLKLLHRKAIWRASHHNPSGDHSAQITRDRRVALDILCVEHAMPIWKEFFPDDEGPQRMLSIASHLVDSDVSIDEAQRARDKFYVDSVEDRDYEQDQIPAMFVAHAAANTVITAMVKDIEDAIPSVETDQDLDPDAYLPSYLCASACAGGLDINHVISVKRRRDFWKWYLHVAIPQVMSNNVIQE